MAEALGRTGDCGRAGVGLQGRGRPVQAAVGVRGGYGSAGWGTPHRRWDGGQIQLRQGVASIATQFDMLK